MSGWDVVIVAGTLFAYALFSGRLRGTPVTAPIVFVSVGLLLGDGGLGVLDISFGSSELRLLAEVTLALVLFVDASSIDTRRLRRESSIPLRLLGLGLPGTIALGTLMAVLVFPDLEIFEAMVLAVLLAPTDAALGQIVVSDPRLPSMVRQGLNVESGLNDGICVPVLLAALTLAETEAGFSLGADALVELVRQLAIAVSIGLAIGVVVSLLARWSANRDWLDPAWAQIIPLATAVGAYAATQQAGGSGFIAAFVAGLVYGRVLAATSHESAELTEDLGDVLSAVTFVLFGAVLITIDASTFEVRNLGFAVLGLTVIRMVPVALSLLGSGARPVTVAFVGWFGPRGLATIVFALTVVEESGLASTGQIVDVAMLTVLLSVFAHGLTAVRLSNSYVRWFSANRSGLAMETREVGVGHHRRSR